MIHRGYLQMRLQSLFSSIQPHGSESSFYTEIEEDRFSVFTRFNNGVDPSPLFSGTTLAKLSLDPEGNLILDTWPQDPKMAHKKRIEILMSHIESIQLTFLGESKEKNEPHRITANLAWKTSWPKTLKQSPSMIRLEVYEKESKTPIRFAFILPVPGPIPTYVERSVSIGEKGAI